MAPPLGILVLAYGGPESLADVEPFLRRVMAPREPSAEVVERARHKYAAIGGGSPLAANTRAQARALEAELERRRREGTEGPPLRFAVGFMHWDPSVGAAIEDLVHAGCEAIHAVILASHRSRRATGGYEQAVAQAVGSPGRAEVRFAPDFHGRGGYLGAVTERAADALAEVGSQGTQVLFTAHSLPLVDGREDEGYRRALGETASAVAARLGIEGGRLAFQSASRRPGVEWMGPSATEVLEELVAEEAAIVVVPLGFVSEHLETLWDLDRELAAFAGERGVSFARAATVGVHPGFIAALADTVEESITSAPARET